MFTLKFHASSKMLISIHLELYAVYTNIKMVQIMKNK